MAGSGDYVLARHGRVMDEASVAFCRALIQTNGSAIFLHVSDGKNVGVGRENRWKHERRARCREVPYRDESYRKRGLLTSQFAASHWGPRSAPEQTVNDKRRGQAKHPPVRLRGVRGVAGGMEYTKNRAAPINRAQHGRDRAYLRVGARAGALFVHMQRDTRQHRDRLHVFLLVIVRDQTFERVATAWMARPRAPRDRGHHSLFLGAAVRFSPEDAAEGTQGGREGGLNNAESRS